MPDEIINKDINDIRQEVMHQNAVKLSINRVPRKEFELFMNLADEEFCGDRGMALKYLVDEVIVRADMERRIGSIFEEHETRLNKLESDAGKQIQKRSIDGSVIL